jgi:hypothetical protein
MGGEGDAQRVEEASPHAATPKVREILDHFIMTPIDYE